MKRRSLSDHGFSSQHLREPTPNFGGLCRDDLAEILDSVVKNSSPNHKICNREVHALEVVHQDGIFPDVVRLLQSDDGPDDTKIPSLTAPIVELEVDSVMIEHRGALFVIGSTGEGLLMAESVLDILKAIFDTLESKLLISFISS